MNVAQMAQTLKDRMGGGPRRTDASIAHWLLRAVALFDPEVRSLLPELEKRKNATTAKGQRLLGWNPRPRGGGHRRGYQSGGTHLARALIGHN
jgi:dihydroflavonol-4-reductase